MHFDNYTFIFNGLELATWFMTQAEAKRVARLLGNAYPDAGLKLQRVGNTITDAAPSNRMDKLAVLEERLQLALKYEDEVVCFANHDGEWGPVFSHGGLLYA